MKFKPNLVERNKKVNVDEEQKEASNSNANDKRPRDMRKRKEIKWDNGIFMQGIGSGNSGSTMFRSNNNITSNTSSAYVRDESASNPNVSGSNTAAVALNAVIAPEDLPRKINESIPSSPAIKKISENDISVFLLPEIFPTLSEGGEGGLVGELVEYESGKMSLFLKNTSISFDVEKNDDLLDENVGLFRFDDQLGIAEEYDGVSSECFVVLPRLNDNKL